MKPAFQSARAVDSLSHERRETVARPSWPGVTLPQMIGNTPLLQLRSIARDFPAVEVLAKAEWLNPGGSVKDRAAASIIAEAQHSGQLRPGKILLDSTS